MKRTPTCAFPESDDDMTPPPHPTKRQCSESPISSRPELKRAPEDGEDETAAATKKQRISPPAHNDLPMYIIIRCRAGGRNMMLEHERREQAELGRATNLAELKLDVFLRHYCSYSHSGILMQKGIRRVSHLHGVTEDELARIEHVSPQEATAIWAGFVTMTTSRGRLEPQSVAEFVHDFCWFEGKGDDPHFKLDLVRRFDDALVSLHNIPHLTYADFAEELGIVDVSVVHKIRAAFMSCMM